MVTWICKALKRSNIRKLIEGKPETFVLFSELEGEANALDRLVELAPVLSQEAHNLAIRYEIESLRIQNSPRLRNGLLLLIVESRVCPFAPLSRLFSILILFAIFDILRDLKVLVAILILVMHAV